MKRLLDGLRAVHSDRMVAGPQAGRNAYRSTKVREDEGWRETVSTHPVVRTHPETGRKLLFVNAVLHGRLRGHDGGRKQAAARLPARARPPAGIHLPLPLGERARSRSGTTASVKHLAMHDAGPFRRLMRRVQIAGDVPY